MISLVAAHSANFVIGKDNTLPRHYSEDLKHFKRITTGKTVVMGRKTFDSIGKPLPKRKNIVLTKNKNRNAPGVEVIHDVSLLTHVYEDSKEELCVIGGEQIYKLFLPYASILHLTHIHKEVDGDTFFPHYSEWFLETARVKMGEFDFITYERSASQEK